MHTQVYNINNESVGQLSQFISVKVKKNLRKSQAQFRKRLRKLRLRQNDGFLIKKRMFDVYGKYFALNSPILTMSKTIPYAIYRCTLTSKKYGNDWPKCSFS